MTNRASRREIVAWCLYDFADSAETRAMIEGITSVRARRVVGRAADARPWSVTGFTPLS